MNEGVSLTSILIFPDWIRFWKWKGVTCGKWMQNEYVPYTTIVIFSAGLLMTQGKIAGSAQHSNWTRCMQSRDRQLLVKFGHQTFTETDGWQALEDESFGVAVRLKSAKLFCLAFLPLFVVSLPALGLGAFPPSGRSVGRDWLVAVGYRDTGEVMPVCSQSRSAELKASLNLAKPVPPDSPSVSVRKDSCRSFCVWFQQTRFSEELIAHR